jgi:predicted anti-sigma-YlaC factor YlaD
MCENIQEIAEDSIRSGSPYPVEVEDHLHSCGACSQYIALVTLVSSTGRPSVQLPPVELTDRIASMTFAKQSTWQMLFAKPSVFAPAIGLVAVAGWLISGLGDVNNVARVDAKPQPVNNPLVVSVFLHQM